MLVVELICISMDCEDPSFSVVYLPEARESNDEISDHHRQLYKN